MAIGPAQLAQRLRGHVRTDQFGRDRRDGHERRKGRRQGVTDQYRRLYLHSTRLLSEFRVFGECVGDEGIGMAVPDTVGLLQPGDQLHVPFALLRPDERLPLRNRATVRPLNRREVGRRPLGLGNAVR